MKSKGFLSRDFIIQVVGLVFSIVVVVTVYNTYILPAADEIKMMDDIRASQNPDGGFIPERSLVVLLKNIEQETCLILMMWATIIIGFKFVKLQGEQSMMEHPFLKISRGERIIPEDALGHYKEVESQLRRSQRLRGKILPDVIQAALHRFDATRSIQDAAHAMRERAEMAYEQLESDLSLIRYIAWAIPSVGFIGTVRGIGEALEQADMAIRGDISGVTTSLGLAFNSTFVALMLSIVLMLMVHLLQSKQESLVIELQDNASKKVIGLMKKPTLEESKISFT
ncbi:MAG: MotA/TolQ/ExbB proton channel family protein [Opitutaceae bacterium]|nr:MotA/TolQ/ExbB proton channel family protein [Opitutaceae bacterium]